MANRGVIGGRVTVSGSPTRAYVSLKDIRQANTGRRSGGTGIGAGVSLPYYKYGTTDITNVPAVYTDDDGRFRIFFSWEGAQIGEFMNLPTVIVGVMPTGYDTLYRRAQGRCLVTTDAIKLIENMLTVKLGISRAMAKLHETREVAFCREFDDNIGRSVH